MKHNQNETTWWYFGISHLSKVGMSYGHHCSHACKYGFRLIWLGITSIVHAFVPGIFKFYSAKGIIEIYHEINELTHIKRIIDEKSSNDSRSS